MSALASSIKETSSPCEFTSLKGSGSGNRSKYISGPIMASRRSGAPSPHLGIMRMCLPEPSAPVSF